jgi:hypothetical protein
VAGCQIFSPARVPAGLPVGNPYEEVMVDEAALAALVTTDRVRSPASVRTFWKALRLGSRKRLMGMGGFFRRMSKGSRVFMPGGGGDAG